MKVFYNKNGTLNKVIGDSIFSQSNDSNVLQIKIDFPETSALQTVFLVPDGEGGVAPAEPLIMSLKPDYEDGGYMWQALIGAEYLDGVGKAYLSVRVLNESETVIKTTRLVQFTIEPSGSYEPTIMTTEQADQILLLVAEAQANIIDLQEFEQTKNIYKADATLSGINNSVLDLTVTVPDLVTIDEIQKYGLTVKIKPPLDPFNPTQDQTTNIGSVLSGFDTNIFRVYITVLNESLETVIARKSVLFSYDLGQVATLERSGMPTNNQTDRYTFDETYAYCERVVYKKATTSVAGFISGQDKAKLDTALVEKTLPYSTATLAGTQEIYIKDGANARKATLQEIRSFVTKDLTGIGRFEIVTELPLVGESNVVYLLLVDVPEIDNYYEEYIWLTTEEQYELIGTTQIDFIDSNLANTSTLDEIADKTNQKEVNGHFANNGTFNYLAIRTYSENEIVKYAGTFYKSLQNENIGNQPDTATTYWEDILAVTAEQVSYNNTASGLTSTNIQGATDEIVGLIGDVETLLGGI